MARFYKFQFSDKTTHFFSQNEACTYANDNNVEVIYDGADKHYRSPKTRIRDGFQSGVNPGIGKYAGGPRELARKAKDMGLVEVGNEKIQATEKKTSYFDHNTCKALHNAGVTDSTIDSVAD